MVQGWREDTFKLAEKLLSRKNLNVLVSASEFTSHFRYDNNHTTCVLVRGCEVYVGWAKRNRTETGRGILCTGGLCRYRLRYRNRRIHSCIRRGD